MAHSAKQIYLLGRILLAADPEGARDYFAMYESYQPVFTDTSDISHLWADYSDHNENSNAARRLFVCTIFHLYCPIVFSKEFKKLALNYGITKATAVAMGTKCQRISQYMGEAIVWYNKNYDGFKDDVDNLLQQFKQLKQAA